MGYRLDPTQPTPDEIRRVAEERIDDALERLDDLSGASPAGIEEAVHEVRKRCKELRGLARLVRPALGDEFTTFNGRVKRAADELSSIRDAHAVLATFDELQSATGDQQLESVRSSRAAAAERATASLTSDDRRLRRARKQLIKARKRLARWHIRPGFDDLSVGLERTYRQGRRGLKSARRRPTDESVHEWRKAVKNLWYQMRLLGPTAPSVVGPLEQRLDDLADALGDDHDLAVLIDRLEQSSDLGRAETEAAIELARRQQRQLRGRAFRLGATVYAEPAEAFARRIETYWDIAVARGPELATGGIAALVGRDEAQTDHGIIERERKFLVHDPPPLTGPTQELRQGYLAIDGPVSVRLRESAGGGGHTLTLKAGFGGVRTELEWPIDQQRFDALWDLTDGRRVIKTRYGLEEGDLTIEVDVFGEVLTGLVIAEVEFRDASTMESFEPPDWFGAEVTDDPRYSNASLALQDGL
ncbi:MAG: CHAD domain-containing protein [Acidimicrobiia bacterium]|nr:CHAD domain-containing protein [Acidimicrobiia bacterium]